MKRLQFLTFIMALVALPLLFACAPAAKDQQPAPEQNQDETNSTTTEPEQETTESETTEPETIEPETTEPETTEPDADEPEEPTAKKSTSVLLGSDELMAGIPGDGPVTVEKINAWLADNANHQTLEVRLPVGLAVGAGGIKGLQKNPLTRAKIELGRQLYFDRRLSADNTVSCADCHDPDEGFARHTQFGVGIDGQTGGRNSPVSYNRILSDAQFWDGRAGSLEEQAVGPIASPIEMGNTHEKAVATLKGIEGYRLQFEKIFDDGVTIDNVGRAIASFERVIVSGPTAFDFYEPLRAFEQAFKEELEDLEALKEDDPEILAQYQTLLQASQSKPMSDSAKLGREIFFTDRGGCTACHVGPNLADEKYHNLGIGMDQEKPDLGRFEVTKDEKDKGAFKTPTIRNVELSAPYMHDGTLKTLEEVVDWYVKGGHGNPQLSEKVKKLTLNDAEKTALVDFMKACTGDFPKIETGKLPQ